MSEPVCCFCGNHLETPTDIERGAHMECQTAEDEYREYREVEG